MKNKILIKLIICTSIIISVFMINNKNKIKEVNSKYEYNIPVLMYHFFTKSSSRVGQYTILSSRVEEDLKYIKDNYISITTKNLIQYKEENIELPSNSIMITIDDSSVSFYNIMFPLLKKYNIPVILNVIGKYSDDNNGFHMTWNQIKEVESSGLVELGSHSYDLHEYGNGRYAMKRFKKEDDITYINRIKQDLIINNNRIESLNGIKPVSFAYPLGYSNDILKKTIKEIGFLASFSCKETLYNGSSLYDIPRFNRDGRLSTMEMFKKIYH